MNAMIDKNDSALHVDKLHYIYKNTGQGCLLRKFFSDRFTVMFNPDPYNKWFGAKDKYPSDFLIDVIGELHRQREPSRHADNPSRYDRQYVVRQRNRYFLKSNTKVSKS